AGFCLAVWQESERYRQTRRCGSHGCDGGLVGPAAGCAALALWRQRATVAAGTACPDGLGAPAWRCARLPAFRGNLAAYRGRCRPCARATACGQPPAASDAAEARVPRGLASKRASGADERTPRTGWRRSRADPAAPATPHDREQAALSAAGAGGYNRNARPRHIVSQVRDRRTARVPTKRVAP